MLSICLDTLQASLNLIAGDGTPIDIAIVIRSQARRILDAQLEGIREASAPHGRRTRARVEASAVGIAKHAVASRVP